MLYDRASLHDEVQVSVVAAVPEAIDVGVTTTQDGLANALSLRVDVPDPSLVSAALVDRAIGAAWRTDGGRSSYVILRVRYEQEPLHLGELMAEMGLGSGATRNISLSREVLNERYGG